MNRIRNAYLNMLEKYAGIKRALEWLFIGMMFVYVLCQMIYTTTFSTAVFMGMAGLILQGVAWSVVLKTGTDLVHWKELILAVMTGGLFYLIYRTGNQSMFLFYAWIVIGTVGICYRKLLRVFVVAAGALWGLAVLASLTGTIRNLIYMEEYGFRDSFGICYPTDFVSYLFYFAVFFWIAWDKIPDWVSLAVSVLLFAVAAFLAQSDTCTICAVLFAGILLLFMIWKKWFSDSRLKRFKKILDGLLIGAFPLMGIFMAVLIMLRAGNTAIGYRLDGLLTGRLGLASRAISENGVHALATEISMIGRGFNTFPVDGYNFIDSTYPLLLIRYGWIFTVVICLLWMNIVRKAVKNADYRMAFGMGLIAVHSLAEHHFVEIFYNILIVMPFASYEQKKNMRETEDSEKKLPQILPCFMSIGAAAVSAPLWLSVLRTICGWIRIKEGRWELAAVIFCMAGILVFVISFSKVLSGLLQSILGEGKERRIALALILALRSVSGLIFAGSIGISRAASGLQELVDMDTPVAELISENKTGSFYVSELPVLYKKMFRKIRLTVFMGEDYAREKNISVLTSRDSEWNYCFRKGFQYAPISEKSAVYTNDVSVIRAMEEEGYKFTDYYPEKKQLQHGTELDLVKGTYTVTCQLKEKSKNVTDQGEAAARILIMSNWGKYVFAEHTILRKQTDENGILNEEFTFELKDDMAGMVFYLLPQEGYPTDVEDFYVRMTP